MKRFLAAVLFFGCILSFSVFTLAETVTRDSILGMLKENYVADLYTTDSYRAYQVAEDWALYVVQHQEATQEDLNDAYQRLVVAKEGLVLLVDRQPLETYLNDLEEVIHSAEYDYAPEVEAELIRVRELIQTLYEKPELTQEEISAAEGQYRAVMENAMESYEVFPFSPEDAKEGVFVPTKVYSSAQQMDQVTIVRVTIVGVGLLFTILGIIATIIYMKPPKILK